MFLKTISYHYKRMTPRRRKPSGNGKRSPGTGSVGPVEHRVMDRVYELISEVKGQARGNFLGLLNVLIGRHIKKADGTPVSQGLTWRELAAVLKKLSWEKEWVRELGLDPSELTPRDRGQFWYSAINRAQVDSPEAHQAGDRMAEVLETAGYVVGPSPNKT